jgi:hypothetical protein
MCLARLFSTEPPFEFPFGLWLVQVIQVKIFRVSVVTVVIPAILYLSASSGTAVDSARDVDVSYR